jgi:hypothetical protein
MPILPLGETQLDTKSYLNGYVCYMPASRLVPYLGNIYDRMPQRTTFVITLGRHEEV